MSTPAVVGTASEAHTAIVVHVDRLTIGDLEVLERFSNHNTTAAELIDFVQRLVDEDVRAMPMSSLGAVLDAVNQSIVEAKNPGN